MNISLSENDSYLKELIRALSYNRKYNICIYDISGILDNHSVLSVEHENKFRHSPFCNAVKLRSKSLNLCLKCKRSAILKASKSKAPYIGKCYMGISEIVHPVFINDKLICIVYIGNLCLENDKEDIIARIEKYSRRADVDLQIATERIDTIDIVDKKIMQEYMNIARIIHDSIVFAFKATKYNSKFPDGNCSNFIVEAAKAYIRDYYALDLKIEHVARLHFVSPNYLRNLFKKYTNTSFTDYVNQYRINEAINLLENTKHNIVTIASMVGYNNVTYFNKLIKRYTGLNPKQYRNKGNT